MGTTGDAANAFLSAQRDPHEQELQERKRVWDGLLAIFRDRRPDDLELTQVSLIAEVAIDQVFSAHRIAGDDAVKLHPQVKDYAECASLYGFVMGMALGRDAVTSAVRSALGAGD